MFESIRNIFQKKQEKSEEKRLTLKTLQDWLNTKEEACTGKRNAVYKKSREDLLRLEQDLKGLLNEFKEESIEEPHHHKVEQVNRHALPQFIKKIESELKGEFSDDDEIFYQEIADLISGCFSAYKGPGRYLHHLYPEEVKTFRQTLDQMGRELNRMTKVMRISRERLLRINSIREILSERDDLLKEIFQSEEEEKSIKAGYEEGHKHLETIRLELKVLNESEAFRDIEKKNQEYEELEKLYLEKRASLESLIRTAVSVWKRAERLLSEQKRSEDEKNVKELIHSASSAHRSDEDLLHHIKQTSGAIFGLFQSGTLQAKNSFEKNLFSSEDAYLEKISGLFETSSKSLSDKSRLREELDCSDIMRKRERLLHDIREEEREISSMETTIEKINERRETVREKLKENQDILEDKFGEFKEENVILDLTDDD